MKKKKKKRYNLNAILKNAIRRTWEYSQMRKDAIDLCKIYAPRYKNNGERHKVDAMIGYKCQKCCEVVEKIEVHHLVPVAPEKGVKWSWDSYIEKMFNGKQVGLCKECHLSYHPERRKKK